MGKGGDGRGKRKRPWWEEQEAGWWDRGGTQWWEDRKGSKGGDRAARNNRPAAFGGELPRRAGGERGAAGKPWGKEGPDGWWEREKSGGKGGTVRRRPAPTQGQRPTSKGRPRKDEVIKVDEEEEEIQVPDDEEEGLGEAWKLLDKKEPEKEEPPEEEDEEDEDDWQLPEPDVEEQPLPEEKAPVEEEDMVDAPESAKQDETLNSSLQQEPPPEVPDAGPPPRKRRRGDYGELSEEGLNFSVQLANVPVEYTHTTLEQLHESLGLNVGSLQTSKFMEPRVGDEEHTCQVILRYADKESAVAAVSKLGGQSVTTSDGTRCELHAGLRSSQGPTTINPQVYISDLPLDYSEEALYELHRTVGLPDNALVSCKLLPSKDPNGETRCCIARYQDDQLAEKAIEALRGKRVYTASGSYKHLGARMAKPASWMVQTGAVQPQAEGKGRSSRRPGQDKGEVSRELVDFAKRWALDDTAIDWLSRLPHEVQTGVIDGFDPQDGSGNFMAKLRAFVRTVQASLPPVPPPPGGLEPGAKHTGLVKVWFEERGFGFITPEIGEPDVYVHRSVLSDGSYLQHQTTVTFKAQWDPPKGKYLAQECWGAFGERQEASMWERPRRERRDLSSEPSAELKAFAERWSLDSAATALLARLPEEVQTRIMEEYKPEEPEGGEDAEGFPGEPTNLFVTGLPSDATEELLNDIFREHGKVDKCKVLSNRNNRQTDCAALVMMADEQQAENAIQKLDQVVPEGLESPLTVKYAASNPDKTTKGKGKAKGKGKPKGSPPSAVNHSKAIVMLARSLQASHDSGGAEPSKPADSEPKPAAPPAAPSTASQAPAASSSSSSAKPVVELQTSVMLPGIVKFWNDNKGYGFVNPRGGGPDVFVHRSVLTDGTRLLRNSEVAFEVEWDDETWRYRATECCGAEEDAAPQQPWEEPPPPPQKGREPWTPSGWKGGGKGRAVPPPPALGHDGSGGGRAPVPPPPPAPKSGRQQPPLPSGPPPPSSTRGPPPSAANPWAPAADPEDTQWEPWDTPLTNGAARAPDTPVPPPGPPPPPPPPEEAYPGQAVAPLPMLAPTAKVRPSKKRSLDEAAPRPSSSLARLQGQGLAGATAADDEWAAGVDENEATYVPEAEGGYDQQWAGAGQELAAAEWQGTEDGGDGSWWSSSGTW